MGAVPKWRLLTDSARAAKNGLQCAFVAFHDLFGSSSWSRTDLAVALAERGRYELLNVRSISCVAKGQHPSCVIEFSFSTEIWVLGRFSNDPYIGTLCIWYNVVMKAGVGDCVDSFFTSDVDVVGFGDIAMALVAFAYLIIWCYCAFDKSQFFDQKLGRDYIHVSTSPKGHSFVVYIVHGSPYWKNKSESISCSFQVICWLSRSR